MTSSKKVCIVTWQGSPNYGTNLQAFALQHFLEGLGLSVRILSSIPDYGNLVDVIYYIISEWRIYRFWLRIKHLFNHSVQLGPDNSRIRRWVRRDLHVVRVPRPSQLRKLIDETDCFISGSDQIWNSFVGVNPAMYLDFAENKKRISYATSLGTRGIHPCHAEKIRKWLSRYQHISVREQSSVQLLKSLTRRDDVTCVLDPTFLLSPADWEAFVSETVPFAIESRPFILCYLLGSNEQYKRQVLDIQHKTGIPDIAIVPSAENPSFSIDGATILNNLSPTEFVRVISKASLVCTDSFHGTALSIILSKPFVEFLRFENGDPTSQNCRIEELLDHVGLSSRVYKSGQSTWIEAPDYSKIQDFLHQARSASIKFLTSSIEK